jgi:hypothetical protein
VGDEKISKKVCVIIGKSGRNSSAGRLYKTKITLDDRDVLISFDKHKNVIKKR